MIESITSTANIM